MNHHFARILIADDDPSTLDLLSEMIKNLGYQPQLATNGEEAIELLRENPPDLVLSDVMMPRMDGFELCKRIKSERSTRLIPVVLLTGLGSTEDRVMGIEAGADDFISKPFHLSELSARVHSLLKLKQFTDDLEHAEEVIFSLALAVEAKDPYTQGHCARLSHYSVVLGHRLGYGEDDLQSFRRGGILHDIGKIGIPENILLKPGPLTADETTIMREHPVKGEDICRPLRSLHKALPIIRNHHERWDGKGYPDGLSSDEIPFGARIIAAVDYFDALITDRPYRQALPIAEALRMLHEAVNSGHLDLQIVRELSVMISNIGDSWITRVGKMNQPFHV
ncbi:MAG: HD domain-containing phosphohydrolase [bacterium]